MGTVDAGQTAVRSLGMTTNEEHHIELLTTAIVGIAEAAGVRVSYPIGGPSTLDLADQVKRHVRDLRMKLADEQYRHGVAQQERSEWWARAVAAEAQEEKPK